MESTSSPTSSGSIRRHKPRRSTRGPLESVDDPLADNPTVQSDPTPAESILSETQDSPPTAATSLSFLQQPSNYAILPTTDIPGPFLSSSHQPAEITPLPHLLSQGHYRHAAHRAAELLCQTPSPSPQRTLELYYTRLACLLLRSHTDLAVPEAALLTDSLSEELLPLIPWPLRLLLVRLQALNSPDGGRREVMVLYSLAAEARAHIASGSDVEIWTSRLRDLGLRVVDTLVEMGELETALRSLASLELEDEEKAWRRALLKLRVGDLASAETVRAAIGEVKGKALDVLISFAKGDYSAAVRLCKADDGPMFLSNLAVGLLYTGRLEQGRQVAEELVGETVFPGLLFNLATLYELSSDAMERKEALVGRLSASEASGSCGGWERRGWELKL